MGGYNSGRRKRGAANCEGCMRLEMPWLRKNGFLTPPSYRSVVWSSRGEQTGCIGVWAKDGYIELIYTSGEERIVEPIYYRRTRTNFGGWREWFACPRCHRACGVLYGGCRFRCRKCYRLTYLSQYEEWWERESRKAERTRRKYGSDDRISVDEYSEFPPRPKGMHLTTYAHLVHRDRRLMNRFERGFEMRARFMLRRFRSP